MSDLIYNESVNESRNKEMENLKQSTRGMFDLKGGDSKKSSLVIEDFEDDSEFYTEITKN